MRIHGGQKQVAQHFSSAKKKRTVNLESYIQLKYPSGMKEKLTFSDKGKQRYFITSRSACSKRMARGRSPNKKKAIKEGMLEYHERRKNKVSKNINKYNGLSPLGLSKLYLTVETKIVTLSDVVLNVCRGNI